MASEPQSEKIPRPTRVPLGTSRRRLSFERRLRLWLWLMGMPAMLLLWLLLRIHTGVAMQLVWLLVFAAGWALAVSLLTEQIIRPLQTLANVVSALREDDYSFRARGARRNDALGDLAIEVNALASMLQAQRAGALEAMALVERVINAMQSPVVAFDPEGKLKLLNPAGERAFGLDTRKVMGQTAAQLGLEHLLKAPDDELLSLEGSQQAARWVVKRAGFRLRGVPHTLLVLADVSAALREEERQAWERLIRVLGHEINNSLTPIKSIAASLRGRLDTIRSQTGEDGSDFASGLEVIEGRAESLNRFLQAYRQLMGLPVPRFAPVSLENLVYRVARLETRLTVTVTPGAPATLIADNDQLQQALINLVRNAVDAAESPDSRGRTQVEITWEIANNEAIIAVLDSGPGLSNAANLFVPFYTTKPNGTGIGLVLAQQIAQAHRGSVQLVNRANGMSGCRAELRLPLCADQSSSQSSLIYS